MPKSLNIYFSLLFIFFACSFSFSRTLNYRNYSERDGLPHANVFAALQDTRGYIWFGTNNGISRFDGLEFKNFFLENGLIDNCIVGIIEDWDGNIWSATTRGVSCFSSGRFTNYGVEQGLAHAHVTSIAVGKQDILWLGTRNGLSRFNVKKKTFRNYFPGTGSGSNTITTVAVDREGILWVGTKAGLYFFSNNRFHFYSGTVGMIDNLIYDLFVDSKGRIWVGSGNGAGCISNGKFISYTTKNGLGHESVNVIGENKNGDIYFGTWNGVTILSEGKFSYTNTENGLANNYVTSILNDREGNTWFTTYGGVSCLKPGNIVKYSIQDGLMGNAVRIILQDRKGRYWFGTDGGLNCITNGKVESYSIEDGLESNSILSLFEDCTGKIWIGTFEGINVFSKGSLKTISCKESGSSNFIFGFAQDKDGTVWICSKKGIRWFKNGKLGIPSFYKYDKHVLSLLVDIHGNLWFSTLKGVYRYSALTDRLRLYTIDNGLVDNIVMNMVEDRQGRIWMGTDRGLSCFSNGSFRNYTTKDGLADNICNFVLEDDRGFFWIGTGSGLSWFNGKSFQTYSKKKNGLISDVWNCGLKDNLGVLWFGSPQGVNTFKPPLKKNLIPPPVDITSVKVMGKEEPLTGVHLFDHERNNFKFDFAGLCFTAPESVTYNFQLKGMDRNWQETKDRTVFYPYLPPGNYTFRVKAYNNDGVGSLKPAEFSFQILPPYWKTWWFVTLAFLVVLLMMFVFFHWHFKRMEEKKTLEARTRQLMMSQRMELMGMLAAGAVHDMKNLMTIIIGYSNIIERDADIDDKHNQLLIHIKETANTAVQVVKQILKFSRQKLHPSTTAGNMVFMMDEILELLRVTTPDRITLIWEPPLETILYRINPIRLQQVVMNLCINAIHAMPSGGSLEVSLKRTPDNGIRLVVSDTGKGMEQEVQDRIFDPLFTTKEDGKGTGLGLFVVKQIVEECKGTISFCSQPGVGTTFTIVFPVSE